MTTGIRASRAAAAPVAVLWDVVMSGAGLSSSATAGRAGPRSELAMAVHAETVRIHPFVDGNGRTTRLLADLVLLAARADDDPPRVFDWDVDKIAYIEALHRYDQKRNAAELAGLVGLLLID